MLSAGDLFLSIVMKNFTKKLKTNTKPGTKQED